MGNMGGDASEEVMPEEDGKEDEVGREEVEELENVFALASDVLRPRLGNCMGCISGATRLCCICLSLYWHVYAFCRCAVACAVISIVICSA